MVTIFSKRSIVVVSQGSKYALGSEYARVPKIPEFRIYQNSKYASGSEYDRVVNMPEIWVYQGSEYVGVTQGSEIY